MARSPKRSKERTRPGPEGHPVPIGRRWAGAILGLSLVGALTSGYLAYAHFQLHQSIGFKSVCSINARWSCDAVALSEWSWFAGMPVAAHGTWFYLLLAALTLAGLRQGSRSFPRSIAAVCFALAWFAVGLSAALAAISFLTLQAFCPLCVGLYGLNVVLLIVSWLAVHRTGESPAAALRYEWRYWRADQGRGFLAVAGAVLPLLFAMTVWPAGFAPVASVCAASNAGTGPTELEVYSDFQCPHCKLANRALNGVPDIPGLVVRHRQFPLDRECNSSMSRQLHAGACMQAAAGICAENLGRADELRNALFDTEPVTEEGLVRLAVSFGAASEKFRDCLRSAETARKLSADIAHGIAQGVEGTPTLFVNGRRFLGPIDRSALACLHGRRDRTTDGTARAD